MKRLLPAALLLLLALCLAPAALLSADTPDFGPCEELLRKTRTAWGTPALAVAIVVDGRIAWSAADGFADLENQVPATPATVFRFASISKPIAATAYALLLERGRVALDEPVWNHLPDYPRKGPHILTARHVLTHTSGIRHYRERAGEMDSKQHFPDVAAGLRAFGVHEDGLLFAPGEKFHYSTFAYELVAGIVEHAAGESFAAYVQREIFNPAGMDTARFEAHAPLIPHRARFYRRNSQDGLLNAPWVDNSYKLAGGAVIGTVLDLARFASALDAGQLLSPDTRKLVLTANRLNDGTDTGYGLGWRVEQTPDGRHWAHHSGGAVGGAAFLLRCPDERFAVALLCNLEQPGDLRRLAFEFAALALPAPAAAAAATPSTP